jgi:hypothetical protein
VATVGGVTLHRIVGKKVRKQDERLYGADAALYIGAGGPKACPALWLAVGGKNTPERVGEVLARVSQEAPDGDASAPVPAAQLVLHLSSWIGLAGTGGNEREQRFVEAARLAFDNPDEDTLRIELVPVGNVVRLRMTLDEGYVRLFALALADRLRQQ